MRFHFDANQSYRLRAINAVADLFRGQPPAALDFRALAWGELFNPVGNRLDLNDARLIENLRAVQTAAGLPPEDSLQCIPGARV